jgi:hypothetical protein
MSRYAKRHYEDFARIIARVNDISESDSGSETIHDFYTCIAFLFHQDNPNFNQEKFNTRILALTHNSFTILSKKSNS